MSIPYYRDTGYTDDGCSRYECLNCYTTWEARTTPSYCNWKFCPVCGCQWEGEKKYEVPEWKGCYCPVRNDEPLTVMGKYVLQSRMTIDGEVGEWSRKFEYGPWASLKYMVQDLKKERALSQEDICDWGSIEYRIVKGVFE